MLRPALLLLRMIPMWKDLLIKQEHEMVNVLIHKNMIVIVTICFPVHGSIYHEILQNIPNTPDYNSQPQCLNQSKNPLIFHSALLIVLSNPTAGCRMSLLTVKLTTNSKLSVSAVSPHCCDLRFTQRMISISLRNNYDQTKKYSLKTKQVFWINVLKINCNCLLTFFTDISLLVWGNI